VTKVVKKGLKVLQLKNSIFIIALVLFFFACSKDNTDDNNSIIGKWQLIEYCEDNGGSGSIDCGQIENGYTVQFYENDVFIFVGVNNNNCTTGTYTSNNTKLFLQFENDICSDDEGLFVYLYSFLGNDLELTPSNENLICDEACFEIFKRIPNEE
jgi:hypothetical protein